MARFIASALDYRKLPVVGNAEVAFVGRSNVGKSSLLGMLLGQPKLVRTSRTPGRTQTLNLFLLEERIAIVDMPGYGYAKLPKAQRASIEEMLRGFLRERASLGGVVLLVDARREECVDTDLAMARWVLESGRQLLLVVTKGDLVPKNRRLNTVRAIEKRFGVPHETAILCSAKTGEGKGPLLSALSELTARQPASMPPPP